MVGREGIKASGLNSLSWLLPSGSPVPQTLTIATSLGPVQPKISPEGVTTLFEDRVLSSMSSFDIPISLSAGSE